VRVVGQLTQAQVPDLLQACEPSPGCIVTVDLSDLVSADASGLFALRRLRKQGAQLVNMSHYIESTLTS
jgi:ABC-type transporter Mla MlaB component